MRARSRRQGPRCWCRCLPCSSCVIYSGCYARRQELISLIQPGAQIARFGHGSCVRAACAAPSFPRSTSHIPGLPYSYDLVDVTRAIGDHGGVPAAIGHFKNRYSSVCTPAGAGHVSEGGLYNVCCHTRKAPQRVAAGRGWWVARVIARRCGTGRESRRFALRSTPRLTARR